MRDYKITPFPIVLLLVLLSSWVLGTGIVKKDHVFSVAQFGSYSPLSKSGKTLRATQREKVLREKAGTQFYDCDSVLEGGGWKGGSNDNEKV